MSCNINRDVPQSQITTIRKLTRTLPKFPPLISNQDIPGFKEHKMECGTSLSWKLLNQPEISAARWFNSSGTEFPAHTHAQQETLVIYIGSMFIQINGQKELQLQTGDTCIIPPNIIHKARFLEDCWYLAITVPSNSDWPK